MKGVMRFGKKGKLAPRYIGPFEILEKVGKVAYRLALPPQLSSVHNVFHVSMLRRYERDTSHVIDWQPLEIREDVTYIEQPIRILDRKDQILRTKTISLIKVQWSNHGEDEASWEREDEIKEKYPQLFEQSSKFETKFFFSIVRNTSYIHSINTFDYTFHHIVKHFNLP